MKRAIIRSGLEALYFSGAHRLMEPFVGGVGAILVLHHVRPARSDGFQPNRLLEITPTFLEAVIARLKAKDVDFVTLDEVRRRLQEQDFRRRFVTFTFDDGYRDNKEWAYPILKRHGIPFAIYVPTSFPDRLGELWWAALEAVVARNASIALTMNGRDCRIESGTRGEKFAAFELLYRWLRGMPSDHDMLDAVRDLTTRYGVDVGAICDELCMSWEELSEIAADPLVTIGAHTVNHVMLAKACDTVARSELRMGRAVLEAALGRTPHHLAYPYGDATAAGPREFAIAAELGFRTAVTTRPGVLFPEHGTTLTALPRISINGEFQRERYIDVLLSGAGTALWNGLRRLRVA